MLCEVTMYQAVCDGCGRMLGNPSSDEEEAKNSAFFTEDCQEICNKLYCPDCYEYDEETDEYKPKKKED